MSNTIKISKKISRKGNAKGEDGHKIFSIRIKDEIVQALDEMSEKTNRSRNELIGILLDNGVKNIEIV